ncbi:MAG: sigma-54 dependent transcriptional regulator [Planctomycetota bacterium]
MKSRLLFVDDDETFRRTLARELEGMGFEVTSFATGSGVVEAVTEIEPGVALFDLRLPDTTGVELMRRVHAVAPDLPVVVLTGHGAVPDAVAAMRAGAFDFLTKPAPLDVVESTLRRAWTFRETVRENRFLKRLVDRGDGASAILGQSPAIEELRALTARIAAGDGNVLVLGESGTGKELVARSIHAQSVRSERPFVVVNCGALPETLIASELFGHERGSFTGATQRKTGLIEAASGGTVFLDEIGELPISVPPALLRALQFGEVQPVGASSVRRVDVRVVAATHRDPMVGIREGWFREDLYYRLSALVVEVPPLRERREDVGLLAAAFLEARAVGRTPAWSFDAEAVELLARNDWPGNVRELENAITRLTTLAAGPVVTRADVDRFVLSRRRASTGELPTLDLAELERLALVEALRRHGGDKRSAAAELGVALTTVYNKLSRYGIDANDPR